MKLSEYQRSRSFFDLVKGHSYFKVKCLTFGLYTQVSDSGPLGPLVKNLYLPNQMTDLVHIWHDSSCYYICPWTIFEIVSIHIRVTKETRGMASPVTIEMEL